MTSPNGSIVLFTKMAASISPQHGDSMITGTLLYSDELDEKGQKKLHTGLSALIRGTKQYFPIGK